MLKDYILPCPIIQSIGALFTAFIATGIQNDTKSYIGEVFNLFYNSPSRIRFVFHNDGFQSYTMKHQFNFLKQLFIVSMYNKDLFIAVFRRHSFFLNFLCHNSFYKRIKGWLLEI